MIHKAHLPATAVASWIVSILLFLFGWLARSDKGTNEAPIDLATFLGREHRNGATGPAGSNVGVGQKRTHRLVRAAVVATSRLLTAIAAWLIVQDVTTTIQFKVTTG